MQQLKFRNIGNASFRLDSKIFTKCNNHLLGQDIQIQLKNYQLTITYEDYQKNKWNELFQEIIQLRSFGLKLYNNYNSKILLEIKNVQFSNLKWLQLSFNKINNIQALIQLKCLNLEYLRLDNNNITNLRAFKRIFFSKLDTIHLENNKINRIQFLSKSQFNKNFLRILSLQSQFKFQAALPIIDLNNLFKISSKKILQIQIKQNQKVYQNHALKMFKKQLEKQNN